MLNTDTVYCIMRNDSVLGDTHLCGVFLDGHEASEVLDTIAKHLKKDYREELKWKDCEIEDATKDYYPNMVKAIRINISEDLWELIWIEERKLNQYCI